MSRIFLAGLPTAVAEFGLTWLAQSSALLALGLLAGRVLRGRGPAVQSAVYRTTLAAVLVCPVASALLASAGVDGVSWHLPVGAMAPVPAIEPAVEVPPGPTLTKRTPTDFPLPRLVEQPSVAPLPMPAPIEPPISAGPIPALTSDRPSPRGWLGVAVAVGLATWACGAAGVGLRLVLAARRMGRLRATSIPAEPAVVALCRDLAGTMRLPTPQVLRSPFLASPCVDGLRRPVILLPEDDTAADLRATFVHELAHLARRDGLWNLLRRVASALLWFQPLLWAVSRRLEVTAEEVCDDHVVQFGADRASYAGLLLELAGRSLPPLSPTGVGMISLRSLLARRVVRIMDSSRTLSTRAGTRAVLMTLFAGLVGTLGVGLLAVGAREPQALADEPTTIQAKATPESTTETQTGRVVATNGQPIPGAVVRAIARRGLPVEPGLPMFHRESQEIALAITDADGRYTITSTKPKVGPDGRPIEDISTYVEATGYGVSVYVDGRVLPLVPDDVPVMGRVVDLEGKPIADATIRPIMLTMPWPETRKLLPTGPVSFEGDESIGFGHAWCDLLPSITTDADGRFRVDGVGRDRLVSLSIRRPDLARKDVGVVTRVMGDPSGPLGAHCTIVVEPTRAIEGVVRDIVTGAPIPGTLVTAVRIDEANGLVPGEIIARTDAEGRYRLVGLPKAKAPEVAVYPPLDQPYFIREFLEVPVTPGYEPVSFDIALRRGQWITGRVFNSRDNKPVAAMVDYFPMLDNDRAKDHPNFRSEVATSTPNNARYQTDADGRFRVPGIAGQGVVTAKSKAGGFRAGFGGEALAVLNQQKQLATYNRISTWAYEAIRPVDLPESGATVECGLPLDPAGSVTLRLVDEAGAPVSHAYAQGRNAFGVRAETYLGEETITTVNGLLPGKPRTVLIEHPKRKIGAVVKLPPDGPREGQEQAVVLRPDATVTARFIGAAFPHNVGVHFEVQQAEDAHPPGVHTGYHDQMHIKTVAADAEGRLRFDGLPPGGPYRLEASDRPITNHSGTLPRDFKSFPIAEKLTVQPGQVIDLGTFDVTTGKQVEAPLPAEVGKPEVKAATESGRVVGMNGRPIPGAVVRAIMSWNLPDEPGLEKFKHESREVARAITDADGRYTITAPRPKVGSAGKPIEGMSTYIEAAGYGVLPSFKARMLPLVPDDVPVLGRVVDLEGKPVAGATIRPTQLFMPWPETRKLPPTGPVWVEVAESLGYGDEWCDLLPPITTDADGRFRVDGVGRDRMVELEIARPDLARKRVHVVTRIMDRLAGPPGDRDQRQGINEPGEYGANCTIVVEPTRLIEGVVRDIVTNQPIPGSIVTARRIDKANGLVPGEIMTRTDAEGRYRLVGLPKAKAPAVAVYPPLDQPYFLDEFLEVPVSPGYEPVRFNTTLRRGQWITGRVFNIRDNKPVAAMVDYFPMLTNNHAKNHPNFDPEVMSSSPNNNRYRTDAAGRFRVPGIAGRGVVTARNDEGTFRVGFGGEAIAGKIEGNQLPTYNRIDTRYYQATREVDLPENGEPTWADLPLDPGGWVVFRLVDEAGEPVTGADTNGLIPHGTNGPHALEDKAVATVTGLEPGKARTVMLIHKKRRIGTVIELPADGPRNGPEQTVVLRPLATVTGRFVGARVPSNVGVEVELKQAEIVNWPGSSMRFVNEIADLAAGADGRFRFDGLAAGGTYDIEVKDRFPTERDKKFTWEFKRFPIAVKLTVQPSQAIDLGTFDVTTGKRVEVPAEPAKTVEAATVPIRGRIIDLEGRPVAGVKVTPGSYQTLKAGSLTAWIDATRQGKPPWIWTAETETVWHDEAPDS